MKKSIITIILFAGITLNIFAQQEIPMFFDNDLGFSTGNRYFRIAYSQDGSKVAAIYNERRIVVWDAANGREIIRISGHGERSISGIVFSPNGRQLVSWSQYDSNIKIWNSTTGELILNIAQAGVAEISYSPDGNRIVGSYFDSGLGVGSGLKLWNTTNGNEIWTLTGRYFSAIFNQDGRQLLVNHDESSLRILNAGNGQIIRTIIQKIRSKNASRINFRTFTNVIHTLGYKINFEKMQN